MSAAVANVPREARHAQRALQPTPAGYRIAFDNLKQALTLPTDTPTATAPEWQSWQVVERTNGFHIARETRDGMGREFIHNAVGKVKIFRSQAAADAAAQQANGGAACKR